MRTRKGPVKAVLIGAGNRGREVYGQWALQYRKRLVFVAVAEPRANQREDFSREHSIPPEMQFESWEELLAQGLLGEVCLICTQDQMHTGPTIKALEIGYHVLLEKPMAVTESDCKTLVQIAEKTRRQLRICHVLRYTECFSRVKQAIQDGLIGSIINIEHSENVGYWHFGHSYVRGNWRNAGESSPLILAKTCHDFDILYWLVESPARNIQSFGELSYFHEKNAPPGAPRRCTDGCPVSETCLWYAVRLYVTGEPMIRISQYSKKRVIRFTGQMAINHRRFTGYLSTFIKPLKRLIDWNFWPVTVITDDLSLEGKMKALREGPYGRCVFHCDNDVPDHQTVNIQFENGVTATMTVHGHSYLDGRWFRVSGTKGTITGKFTYGGEKVIYHDHLLLKKTILWESDIGFDAHGGGDEGLMESFVRSLGEQTVAETLTSARASLESHLMAFAAEKSRQENVVVNMNTIRKH
ncbi:MAG: Gfo/Idh/MocA family oxidoreductase [Candidatus Odinarchaeota archaeon]